MRVVHVYHDVWPVRGGIEDYLRDGDNGLHINRDATEIAAKLDRLLSDRELHARLRAAGIATAQNYAWEKVAQQYLSLFDELISERAQSAGIAARPQWGSGSQSLAAPTPGLSA